MANNNSNVSTPIVQNIDRPFTELFDLLPQINAHDRESSQEELISAIETHANNAAYLLLTGMQSLGVILATAAERAETTIPSKHIANIGWLTHSLVNLLESCVFMKENIAYLVDRREMVKS